MPTADAPCLAARSMLCLIVPMAAIMCLAVAGCAAAGGGPAWRVREGHPRLLFHADTTVGGRPMAEVLRERFGDRRYAPDPEAPLDKQSSQMLALRWVASGDEAAAEQAAKNLLAMPAPSGSALSDSYRSEDMAFTFDWLHGWLAEHPDQLKRIEDRMMQYVRRFRVTGGDVTVFHNYTHAETTGYALLALALAGGRYDRELRTDLAACAHILGDKDMLLDAWAYEDGAWHEGIEYALSECFAPLVLTLAAVKSATDPQVDYFALARDRQNDWIRRFGTYLMYKRRGDWAVVRDGDVLPNWVYIGWRQYTPLLIVAHQYADPVLYAYLRAVADRSDAMVAANPSPEGRGRNAYTARKAVSGGWRHVFAVIGKEPDVAGEPQNKLPLTARFGKDAFEHIFFRGGWGEGDTSIAVRAGDFFTHHGHLDVGHFSIYHRGALAIDSGFYAGMYNDHWSNYAARTVAHNCVLVRDPQETFHVHRGDGPVANDGGERCPGVLDGRSTQAPPWQGTVAQRRAHLHTPPCYDMGNVLQFASAHGADYVAIDLTGAYNSTRYADAGNRAKISDYRRQIVYLPAEEIVVVFDRVVATSAAFEKTWLLHTVEKPTVLGGERPTGKDGLIEGTGDVVRVDRTGALEGPEPTAHYDGRMFLQCLLPAAAGISLRGGEGFEFFCDGANRAAGRGGREYGQNSPREPGAWRIEIAPTQPAAETRFLTVMKLGDTSGLQAMPPVTRIGDDRSPLVGLRLKDTVLLLAADPAAPAAALPPEAAGAKTVLLFDPARGIVLPTANKPTE